MSLLLWAAWTTVTILGWLSVGFFAAGLYRDHGVGHTLVTLDLARDGASERPFRILRKDARAVWLSSASAAEHLLDGAR